MWKVSNGYVYGAVHLVLSREREKDLPIQPRILPTKNLNQIIATIRNLLRTFLILHSSRCCVSVRSPEKRTHCGDLSERKISVFNVISVSSSIYGVNVLRQLKVFFPPSSN